MCLAVPAKIMEINDNEARVSIEGAETDANIELIDHPKVGDYVIVHAGIAIEKYDEAEALETLKMIREIGQSS